MNARYGGAWRYVQQNMWLEWRTRLGLGDIHLKNFSIRDVILL